MYLKCSVRRKDGKEHRSWSIVESRRVKGGKSSVQRQVLYLGEINDAQRAGWERTIAVVTRNGADSLRSNLTGRDPAVLWHFYLQLTQIEEAFKNLKGDLALRPIFHKREDRVEAHIFIAFLAYCVQVTLRQRLRAKAPGLTPRAVLEKFAAVQMLDVHLPTTDGRHLVLTRYTQPEPEMRLLLEHLNFTLPPQSPPKIQAPKPPLPPKAAKLM